MTRYILCVVGLKSVTEAYPSLKILTSEIHPVAPNHFGQKYFGTELESSENLLGAVTRQAR